MAEGIVTEDDGKTTDGDTKTNGSTGTDAPAISSTVAFEGDFKTEVRLIAISAIRQLADRIAQISKEHAGDRPIVYASAPVFSEVVLYESFVAQAELLKSELEKLSSDWRTAGVAAAKTPEETLAAVDPLTAATSAMAAAAMLASYLKIDVKGKSVEVEVDTAALRSIFVGALKRRGLAVRVPFSGGVGEGAAKSSVTERLFQLIGLVKLVKTLAAEDASRLPTLEPLAARVKALADLLLTSDGSLLQRLTSVEWTRKQAKDRALLLNVSVASSGGTWSTRTSLWTNLFTGADPRFTGGAAVAFEISDVSSGELFAGDVLYAYYPATTFQNSGAAVFPKDNLGPPLLSSKDPDTQTQFDR